VWGVNSTYCISMSETSGLINIHMLRYRSTWWRWQLCQAVLPIRGTGAYK
jgi:hypothetical protein